MQKTLAAYKRTNDYGVAEFASQATYRMGEVYRLLSADLMNSERPKGLDALALEQYELLLEEQAYPFEEKAIAIHETNMRRSWDGWYDEWIRQSFAALAGLSPARYAKRETELAYSEWDLLMLLRRFALMMMAAALIACGSLPMMPAEESTAVDTPDSVETVEQPSPAAIAAENPYLDSQRRERESPPALCQPRPPWRPRMATARADLEWLIEEYPKLSGPYLNLALLHAAQGHVEEAEHFFQVTLEVNDRNLEAYNQYAIFLRQEGRFDESEAVYLSALDTWENHADTHRNLGVLYDLYRGDREKALAHYYRYQALTGGQDRQVAGWIIDLERQFTQLVQRGGQ